MDDGALGAARLRRLIDAGRALVSELDLDALLEQLLAVAADVTGARYAAIGILDADRVELERFLTRGVDATARRAIGDLPRGRGILGVLIDDPQPLRLDSVGRDPRSYGFPPGHPPMETFLGAPILIRGEAWGNLYLTEKEGGAARFDASDEEAVVVLAEWAGIAIDNARLYQGSERRRNELEQAVRRLEATTAIARAVGGEIDLDRVLELIVKRGRALIDARGVVILLREEGRLVVAATAGEVPASVRGSRVDVAAGEALRSSLDALGLEANSSLLVPLVFRGQSLGMLVAFDREDVRRGFDSEEERLLQAFAASAATAVGTARSVETRRLRDSLAAAEAERGRWARELHDETLQGLGGLRLLLSSGLRDGDPAGMHYALTRAREEVDAEIEGLRGLIRELRPAALDELGPAAAIEELAERMAARHGIEVEARLELSGRLPTDAETAVYRITQEALNNAVKHADAGRVSVRVAEEDEVVHVEVVDDGSGFDVTDPARGFGLMGMRERVELLGGALEIASSDEGTRVSAVLPLPDRA